MFITVLLSTIDRLIHLCYLILLINILGSWLDPFRRSPFFNFIRRMTDPFLSKLRIIIPLGGMSLDISPIIAMMLLRLIREILFGIIYLFVPFI
ncbi:YggT family protein [Leptotrichia sp. OH3620_COT-345]|uniref:YggT family protein n=1 Tax=Leptotrichia sp. OH3620_COT-345 TaxID=2491048 RepID=UPI000F651D0D|nr:YggT family protein [Leptotrichia sp. OH3620_COT-345]RRD40025.1 YggT family protein [Leptotrichia sp. OH3620_COT-345]